MHQRETLFMWKKNKEGVPWDIPSDNTGTGLENGFLLHEKFFFFCLFFMGLSLFFVGLETRGGSRFHQESHGPEKREKKEERKKLIFLTL